MSKRKQEINDNGHIIVKNNTNPGIKIGISGLGMYDKKFWLKHLIKLNPNIYTLYYDRLVKNLDFIIFDGGADVYPTFYGEGIHPTTMSNIRRDSLEMFLFARYFNTSTKYIGICRGHQLLNVFMRGSLNQDLASINKPHKGFHSVVTTNSILRKYVPNKFQVNSYHHQAVKEVAFGLMPTLFEPITNIVEGLEMNQDINFPNNLKDKIRTVQCHPEMNGFPEAESLMDYLFRLRG